MVNGRHTKGKSRLLYILRDQSGPMSGETLGKMLGISRVAVHKQVQSLADLGYPVVSGRNGYSLRNEEKIRLSSWEFHPEENIKVLDDISSTMDEARRMANRYPGIDFTVAARTQSSGRGRRNRSWDSPEGGLWATRVIHPGGSALRLQRYVMAGAAALAGILREKWDVKAELKWPNDVLVGSGKIAGVLGETRILGDRIEYLALGLGMNVNNPVAEGASALKDITGREADRREILRDWVAALDEFLVSEDFKSDGSPLWWNRLMPSAGRQMTCKADGRKIEGKILEVDGLGRLVLAVDGGSKLRLSPGDMDEKWRII